MTPWAGEGVNLALWDALDLARVLAATVSETDAGEKKARTVTPEDAAATWQALLDPQIRAFESAMLARAHEKAAETDRNRQLFLSENGAQALADFFKGFGDEGAAAATTTAATTATATTTTISDGDGDDDEGRMLYGGNSSSGNNSWKIVMDS